MDTCMSVLPAFFNEAGRGHSKYKLSNIPSASARGDAHHGLAAKRINGKKRNNCMARIYHEIETGQVNFFSPALLEFFGCCYITKRNRDLGLLPV